MQFSDLIGSGGNAYSGAADKARAEQQSLNVIGGVQQRLDNTVRIDASSIQQMVEPTGVQDMRNVEPSRDNLAVVGNITINGVSDPQAAASAAANEFEARMRFIMDEYGRR